MQKSADSMAGDPFLRWQHVSKNGGLGDRKLQRKILADMTRADPARAWSMLTSGAVSVQIADVEKFAEAFGEKDAPAAVQFGLALTDDYARRIFLNRLMTSWLLRKPGECIEWVKKQPQPGDLARYFRIQDKSYNLDQFTLRDVQDIVPLYPPSDFLPRLAGGAVERLLQDPAQFSPVLAWVRQLPPSEVKDSVLLSFVKVRARLDPPAAAVIAEEIPDPHMRRQALGNIAARMAKDDVMTALEFATALPEPETARTAWQSVLATWTAQKPAESLAYVSEHLHQITPDVLGVVASSWVESKPVETLQMVARFPDSPQRTSLMKDVMLAWVRKDSDRARAWLQSGSPAVVLPPSDIQKLLQASEQAAQTRMSGSVVMDIKGRKVGWMY